jgi:D-alanyl-D-alanine carboxypeptidase
VPLRRTKTGGRLPLAVALSVAACSVLFGLLIAAAVASPRGRAPASRGAKLNGILTMLASRTDSPGGVLLVQTATSTWRRATGLARLSPRTPMKPSGRFRVSGVGIPFTAALVLQLVVEGTLSLDDTVEKWLPGRVPNGAGAAITVRHLLAQTSGLADAPGGGLVVERPPGTFHFANANYNLLPEIVGDVTSSTFAEQLARRILVPLRLSTSGLLGPSGPLPPDIVHGYSPGRPRLDLTALERGFAPAGELISTAGDLARFERALFGGRVIPRALVKEMQAAGSVTGFDTAGYTAYGLGLMRFPSGCGAAWGARGRMLGYTAWMLSTADGRRTVVALLNVGELSNTILVRQGLNRLVTRALCT